MIRFSQKLLNVISVVWFSLQILTGTSVILRRIWRGTIIKYPGFLSYFSECVKFSTDFRKAIKYQLSWKSVQCEPSCSVRTDRRTDRRRERERERETDVTQLIVTFCYFCERPSYAALSKWYRTFLRLLWKVKDSEGIFKQYCFSKRLT